MGTPLDLTRARQRLDNADLENLFAEELGWDRHSASLSVSVGNARFPLRAVARKRSTVAIECRVPALPDHNDRRAIQRQVSKIHHENLLIFLTDDKADQVWQWVRREEDKPPRFSEFAWRRGMRSGQLLERALPAIRTTLEEEERLSQVDVNVRLAKGFDVEKITRQFYERFKQEHTAFHGFVEGITDLGDRDWYASVMLNRLMFCYFIQKKGLLNGEHDYLRDRLNRLQRTKGTDKFWSFYRHFLLRLFHEGLSLKPGQRPKDLDALIGKIPYLNGGLFLPHDLEEKYKADIQIPDKAFERLFAFFDDYRWHLDERPLRESNEINPDVLGYIFEKYINQKQMGAYYTKEDITGYISQNTIIPFILDQAAKTCAVAFRPPEGQHATGSVWRHLKGDPDRYIYAPVRQGVIDANGSVIPLPREVEAGIKDVSKRGGWNKPATEPFALPTETWREHVARRERCLELRRKLGAGAVTSVGDLVTLNLDIRQFAADVIDNCEDPKLLDTIWEIIAGRVPSKSNETHKQPLSVLDPTCGSGAFLFAALNILEPLYDACLERMGWFLDSLAREAAAGAKPHAERFSDFKRVSARVAEHLNRRYFILKSIIVNNLFGVDIMEEACEICKLRLFLKLVAQVEEGAIEKIEPLPDIDFNIRAGNTLVGFTSLSAVESSMTGRLDFGKDIDRIKTQAEAAATAFQLFKQMQTRHGVEPSEMREGKELVRRKLDALDAELDHYLASEYGVDSQKQSAFTQWVGRHEPLHWLVDFYSIMAAGGFDVVIGNPPYVRASTIRGQYSVRGFATADATDIYAWVLERTAHLLHPGGRSGMIVPLSVTFSEDFGRVRSLLMGAYSENWFSSYGRIPSALFSFDVRVRNTIHLGHKRLGGASGSATFTSRLHRWFEVERPALFAQLEYAAFDALLWKGRVPKIGQERIVRAFEALAKRSRKTLGMSLSPRESAYRLHFKKTAYNWLTFCRVLPPCYDEAGNAVPHTKFGDVYFASSSAADTALLLLNGKLMFAYWVAIGDDFDLTRWMFADFPCDLEAVSASLGVDAASLAQRLHEAMLSAASFKLNAGRRVGNYNLARCRTVTDVSDARLVLALGAGDLMDELELLYQRVVRTDFDEDTESAQ